MLCSALDHSGAPSPVPGESWLESWRDGLVSGRDVVEACIDELDSLPKRIGDPEYFHWTYCGSSPRGEPGRRANNVSTIRGPVRCP